MMNHSFWPHVHMICVFHHRAAKSHEGLGDKGISAVEALLFLSEQISLTGEICPWGKVYIELYRRNELHTLGWYYIKAAFFPQKGKFLVSIEIMRAKLCSLYMSSVQNSRHNLVCHNYQPAVQKTSNKRSCKSPQRHISHPIVKS